MPENFIEVTDGDRLFQLQGEIARLREAITGIPVHVSADTVLKVANYLDETLGILGQAVRLFADVTRIPGPRNPLQRKPIPPEVFDDDL
jgi:hypothetical protein